MSTDLVSPPRAHDEPSASLLARELGGHVSAALEADLRGDIRRHGVVVWLDAAGHYTKFVERLGRLRESSSLPYEVRGYRDSHLALMLALEGVAGGTEKAPLVVHLPGFTEESVRLTPLYELYAAGARYRKGLESLITEAAAGHVLPQHITDYAASARTLEEADTWLEEQLQGTGGGFSAQLRALRPVAFFDELLDPARRRPFGQTRTGLKAAQPLGTGAELEPERAAPRTYINSLADERAAWRQLVAWTGLPDAWLRLTLPLKAEEPESSPVKGEEHGEPAAHTDDDIAFAAASWALAVEYVYDLKRPPVSPHLADARALPGPLVDICRGVAVHLRERHPDFYLRTANETEALLIEEVEAAKAEDLGKIDTFRFEEDKVLEAALAALGRGEVALPEEWARLRLSAKPAAASFWLRQDPAREQTWQLVRATSQLLGAIDAAGSLGDAKDSELPMEVALAAYITRGAAVDQAHRHLEQRRLSPLTAHIPEFEALRARLDDARGRYDAFAEAWARDFNACCQAQRFLPAPATQQRTLFDEVVRPMTQEGTTAYFVVDALRYEMGEELFRLIEGTPSTLAQLTARLAELPTVTEVGMNALAPVVYRGRLSPVLSSDHSQLRGFQAGEYRVHDPETRRRAMHDRVGGATCPRLSLEEVVSRDAQSLKRSVAKARLIMVHSQEIDQAGEHGFGLAMFDTQLQQLRAAWQRLREAGVRRFVFTSDHGFLLLRDGAPVQPHGRGPEVKRRYALSKLAADHPEEVRVPLLELGYDGVEGHLIFPRGMATFDTGRRERFVHGGNSLQERAIPVLTVIHRAAVGGSSVSYLIETQAREDVADMHCLEARVEVAAQGALDFGGPREIELSLRVADAEGVEVELCQARGKERGQAGLRSGLVVARVGEWFELFFRLSGRADARVLVELYHPGGVAEVTPGAVSERFAVAARRGASAAPTQAAPATEGQAPWYHTLTDEGARRMFEHLEQHGAVTEGDALKLLGSARAARRFALQFDGYARQAPYRMRITVVGNEKRYIKEGSG